MITTQNIYKAIRTRLNTDFSTVTIQTKDFKNPQPPCFYIQYVASNETESANDLYNTVTSFAVVYFANKNLLDLLQKEGNLRHSFKKPLKVDFLNGQAENRFLECNINTAINETDYILTVTLDFNFYQNGDIDNPYDEYRNNSNMEELSGI